MKTRKRSIILKYSIILLYVFQIGLVLFTEHLRIRNNTPYSAIERTANFITGMQFLVFGIFFVQKFRGLQGKYSQWFLPYQFLSATVSSVLYLYVIYFRL